MKATLFCLLLLLSPFTAAHDNADVPAPMALDNLMSAFGWDMSAATITTEKVTDGLYVLFGMGGNIAVTVGDDGVLIVDDQFPELIPQINTAIGELGGNGVDFAINTHWHFDHAEGNLALGPAGTVLVSHANSREMMKGDHLINLVVAAYEQKAYPQDALPVITYKDSMQFHFNGQQIDLLHFGPAHTTGDTAIFFRGDNAVHLGDVFNNAGYPFIDAGNGGGIDGVIEFCSQVLSIIESDTVVIPGHGPISDYDTLQSYVDMLTVVRERLAKLIESDASLEDVYAAKVTAEFDEKFGDNTGFIDRSYHSLTHPH
ncbi:MAG: MBL fold metallo-hydrolase [Halieaceae bacterium]